MGKQAFGGPYDPQLRKSELGHRIYIAWKRMRAKKDCCEEWGVYPCFYEWALQSGYEPGKWLLRKDDSKPYGPNNCVWYVPNESANHIPMSWEERWNKAANTIRKHYGMPPLEGTSYDDL